MIPLVILSKINEETCKNKINKKKRWLFTTFTDTYLTIRADRKIYKINFQEIKYIEGQKAYVTFHTNKRRITALTSLKELEESLPKKLFIRIHKSYIVAIHEILSLEGNVIEVNDLKLPVGKMYKEDVLKIFEV
ncbi:LytR/AlgR family response regulator transcription factor [uncultured Draconibacterium sp.]|uniref:LytR/AlgR family response regulator transcription factor n=1 Tax=uncultured Draconibacterium sp. TaxID=1573823 RepID=UPI00374A643F